MFGTSFIPLLHLVFQLLSNYESHLISFQYIYFWIEVVRVDFCCLQPKNPKWYRHFLPLILCPLWFQASGYHEFGREAVLQKDSPPGKCSWRWRPEWAGCTFSMHPIPKACRHGLPPLAACSSGLFGENYGLEQWLRCFKSNGGTTGGYLGKGLGDWLRLHDFMPLNQNRSSQSVSYIFFIKFYLKIFISLLKKKLKSHCFDRLNSWEFSQMETHWKSGSTLSQSLPDDSLFAKRT